MLTLPPINLQYRRFAAVLFMVFLVAVTVALLMPVPQHDLRTPAHADKLVHFGVFFCLALPAFLVCRQAWALTMIALVAYGGMIELVQPYFGRGAEWADFWANSIGVVAALPVAYQLRRVLASGRR